MENFTIKQIVNYFWDRVQVRVEASESCVRIIQKHKEGLPHFMIKFESDEPDGRVTNITLFVTNMLHLKHSNFYNTVKSLNDIESLEQFIPYAKVVLKNLVNKEIEYLTEQLEKMKQCIKK